ncbi:MAG: cobalt ECF transporter T component CbiQ [Deltaproteobacteria bacterium RBG_16_47_11]|nr:MAG: cobalt ECF transporter T component CbiQ [Deltaproteobacteria bacterium RBG_16_47_11]
MRHAFLDHHSSGESAIHHLDARAKIVVFFTFTLITVSSPPHSFVLFGLLAMTLIGIALSARLPLGHLVKKVLVILPFLFVVAISVPFMKKDGMGGGYNLGFGGLSVSQSGLWILWNVVIKSSLGVFSIILLSSTTTFPKLIKGMERLGSPKIFTILASFMYRYSFILIDEMQRMKRARDSRCFGGRWFWQSKVIGHMVGTLFLRSFHRGERVYLAMLSRGYHGAMPETAAGRFGLGEILFLFLSPILLFLRIYLG